jgi:hypothetical protein
MRTNTERFHVMAELDGVGRGEADDIANALRGPYTVLTDKRSNEYHIVWDAERAELEASEDA